MKKQHLKSLQLNKKTISEINSVHLKGGANNNNNAGNSGAAATVTKPASGVTFTYDGCGTLRFLRSRPPFCMD
ncbi:hypothetical protein [Kordia sp.]|uniref:hypothetical protein n=1 Tax=Kordia sp. TaxID=1965332 RepID=UPI003B5A8A86